MASCTCLCICVCMRDVESENVYTGSEKKDIGHSKVIDKLLQRHDGRESIAYQLFIVG